MGLPRVFFDMTADGAAVGRIVIEVSRQPGYLTRKKISKICRLEKCGREKSKMVEGYGSLSFPRRFAGFGVKRLTFSWLLDQTEK